MHKQVQNDEGLWGNPRHEYPIHMEVAVLEDQDLSTAVVAPTRVVRKLNVGISLHRYYPVQPGDQPSDWTKRLVRLDLIREIQRRVIRMKSPGGFVVSGKGRVWPFRFQVQGREIWAYRANEIGWSSDGTYTRPLYVESSVEWMEVNLDGWRGFST